MPLTPEDVSNKRFTPVRLREGYDMGEVDQFLDEVEAELVRLSRENQDLRSKLSSAQKGGPMPGAASGPAEGATAVAAPAPETIKVTTVAEASSAAARLLEMAAVNADDVVAEARQEADRLVGDARSTAGRLEAESRARAEEVEAEARARADRLEAETQQRRQQMFGELEREREALTSEVDGLRAFEREYRSRLRSYFEQQLELLDGAAPAAGDGTTRLRSLLEDDEDEARAQHA